MSISRIRNIAMISAMFAAVYRQESPDATGQSTATPEQTANAEQAAKDVAEAKAAKLAEIKSRFDNTVDVKEVSYYFRTVTDEKTGVKTKRPTVELPVAVPSFEGIIGILDKGGKGAELLLEAVGQVIIDQVREYVNDNENVSADNLPYEKFTWDYIANLPKADRRGGGIPKESWDDFAKDYVEIMPAITGKTKEQVELAAKVFVTKFNNAKTNKPVLQVLQSQLGIYTANTKLGDQLAPVLEWLTNKLEALISTDESKLLEAL